MMKTGRMVQIRGKSVTRYSQQELFAGLIHNREMLYHQQLGAMRVHCMVVHQCLVFLRV